MDALLSGLSSLSTGALSVAASLEDHALAVLASRALERAAPASSAPTSAAWSSQLERLERFIERARPLFFVAGSLLSFGLTLELFRFLRAQGAPPGQDGDEAPTALPPAAPGAPPQAVHLTPLEASLLRACSVALPPTRQRDDDPRAAFASVGGLAAVLARLQEQAVLPLRCPGLLAHSALLQAPSGVLLYGPPGTGKTLLARCLAQSSRARFLSFSAATLQNMYVGQSARLVAAAFTLARKVAPCIMFFDELDGLIPRRDGSGGQMSSHAQEFIANFLSAWEGVGGGASGGGGGSKWVLVVAASNRPAAIDPAALRRLPCQLEVPLPDAPAREDILRVLLRGERVAGGVARELRALAAQTEGYSGSDLREVVKAAALLPVQEALGEGGGGGEDGAVVRELTAVDLMLALDRVRPAVDKPMEYLKRSQGGR